MSTIEGSLSKWTNVMKGWQYRWFVLDEQAGILSYYTSREKMMRGVRRGCVRLKGAIIGIDDEDDSTFTITVDGKTFHFQARDSNEREKWVRCLEDTIVRCLHCCKQTQCCKMIDLYSDTSGSSSSSIDFDKKLTEADAYLQIIIDKTRDISDNTTCPYESESKVKTEELMNNAKELIEQVKNTIVLLQIAQNSINPTTVEELERNSDFDSQRTNFTPSLSIPDKSYSSSDDDYFDANEDIKCNSSNEFDHYTSTLQKESNEQPSKFIKSNGLFDYDAMYDDSSESDVSLESQGCIITHMLSQVKIGMDLSKVNLPTFILERRSLLEMYADCFAHPDMFIEINRFETERDRIVQVIKWYLCSYHAGRKSSVAKKPYNPILGEIFRCYWNLNDSNDKQDENENQSQESNFLKDGPIPWCRKNQLTFIAEQVSHHPPVSAFYAEHYDSKICFNAHVWTKSKFLGLSIGVHNVGFGTISLLDRNEEYTITFPNGYGRSILTKPWIELGGNVKIVCEKTGYSASVEFLTKPFYGGKKNRIKCDVYSPDDKKSFLSINGEWNNVMEAKWLDGTTEIFADVDQLSIVNKVVKPISEQEENESRRLWKEVTAGLKLNDVSYATKSKNDIEEKQRFEAQQRKQLGVKWETKLFHQIEPDSWQFNKSLMKRLKNNPPRSEESIN